MGFDVFVFLIFLFLFFVFCFVLFFFFHGSDRILFLFVLGGSAVVGLSL